MSLRKTGAERIAGRLLNPMIYCSCPFRPLPLPGTASMNMDERTRSRKSPPSFLPAFRDLVSGRRRGAMAAALRGILAAAEVPYAWAVRWRNHRYDCGARTVHRVDVPVISVGNLTLGGTGKTPLVEWIVRRFLAQGKRWESSAADTGPAAGRTTKPGNWPGNCRACRTCRTPIAWPRPAGRSVSTAARCWCWTMPSSIAASPATWISCSWTPWSRWATNTSFPAARSANRWKGWPERMSSPCRGPTC